MKEDILAKAREYELTREKEIEAIKRPSFHLSSRVGWMNDPNGFSYFNGQYHMFYQYHPYDTNWGPMHWGHAVSTDLLHWEYLPVAIAPDMPYDSVGCFSGSAIELDDGRHLLMYTGVTKVKADKDNPEDATMIDIQQQCLAIGDGINYEKYEGNPVLTEEDLPDGANRLDFRDPKMWRKADGSYLCVVGSRPADGSGQVLLYESKDAIHWNYKKVLVANKNRFGRMWECPDFFELDGRGVLLTSPLEMLAKGLEYHNGSGTLCLIGQYDDKTDSFLEEYDQAIDYGIDFYAPQTILTADGRRIMVGWMQNWASCAVREDGQKWFGQMSLPRELSVRDGRLIQKPLRELDSMRTNPVSYEKLSLTDSLQLDGIKGRHIDLNLELEPVSEGEIYQEFVIHFAKNDNNYVSFSYRPNESIAEIDRTFSGARADVIHKRSALISRQQGKLKLRIILDTYSAEIFINDGETVMTVAYFTPIEAEAISFYAHGSLTMSLTQYDLK